MHTCRHTLERGVIGVQAKIVGDLIRNYKPLGALCLMHNVFSPLHCGSHRSYPTSLSEIIPRGARRNEINKLRFEKKRKEELLDNRESLIEMAFVRKKNNKHHAILLQMSQVFHCNSLKVSKRNRKNIELGKFLYFQYINVHLYTFS